MTPTLTILQGDWIEQLRTLPDKSVHCCVTSPPYWGLRDYGVPGQLGLEKTPEEYVAKMVLGFREVRRVLRDDGVCWVNLGDSYATGSGGDGTNSEKQKSNGGTCIAPRKPCFSGGLKPKDLVGIPWRVAFALQADGWWLRSDIIWHKPSPMPESVTDRPTKAHEYIFLLTKRDRYFYDSEAVKEPSETNDHGPQKCTAAGNNPDHQGHFRTRAGLMRGVPDTGTRNKRSVWTVPPQPYPESHFATFPEDLIKPCILAGTSAKGCCAKCGGPWERVVKDGEVSGRTSGDGLGYQLPKASACAGDKMVKGRSDGWLPNHRRDRQTIDWKPSCNCFAIEDTPNPVPCTVLDCFGGSGTTAQVAMELGRNAITIELNPEYISLIKARTNVTPGLPLA